MTIKELNQLAVSQAKEALAKCCGSSQWVQRLEAQRPFSSMNQLHQLAKQVWFSARPKDWLEAFSHHPKIGDSKNLEKKFAATKDWSNDEQKGVQEANRATIKDLVKLNETYEQKFGFIFIVCASGKSAEEMLTLLKERLPNPIEEEIKIAMVEQNKITKLRLNKLLS